MAGAVVSIVNAAVAGSLTHPNASVAVTASVYEPSAGTVAR